MPLIGEPVWPQVSPTHSNVFVQPPVQQVSDVHGFESSHEWVVPTTQLPPLHWSLNVQALPSLPGVPSASGCGTHWPSTPSICRQWRAPSRSATPAPPPFAAQVCTVDWYAMAG